MVLGPTPNFELAGFVSADMVGVRPGTNGRTAVSPAAHAEALGLNLEENSELYSALVRAFDPVSDRILWESPSCESTSTQLRPASAARFAYRGRPRSDSAAIPACFSEVGARTGVSLALGLTAARRNLAQHHWIVLVISTEGLFRSLSHEMIEELQGVESGLLVVVVDDRKAWPVGPEFGRIGQFDLLDARWLSELGIPCRGPIDGRSGIALSSELQTIRNGHSPVLLHVQAHSVERRRSDLPTESQGRGVLRLVATGAVQEDYGLDSISDELVALARPDARVVAVVHESLRSRLAFGLRRPDRSFALPASDRRPFVQSRGLALGGCRPFILVTSRFLQQTIDQFAHEICDLNLPVTLIVVPDDEPEPDGSGAAVRSTSDLAFLRMLPDTIVAVPRCRRDLRRLVNWSLGQAGPVAIRLSRLSSEIESESESPEPLETGIGEVLMDGQDVTLVALGSQVSRALRAAELLADQGVSVGVIDARFVQPLDRSLLRRIAAQSRRLMTLEDETAHGGFGTAVLEQSAADRSSTPVVVSWGAQSDAPSFDPEVGIRRIVRQVLEFVDGSPPHDGEVAVRPFSEEQVRSSTPTFGLDLFGFSDEALRIERELVKSRRLCPAVSEWATAYEQVGQRSRYLWQWCERGTELTTLPCVAQEHFEHVWQTKVLSIILCVLLDDVADQHGQERFLDALLRIVDQPELPLSDDLSPDERRYADVTRSLTRIYCDRVAGYPCYEVYSELLRFDLLQFFNALRYSHLLNRRPSLLNVVEHDLYLPHNMHMMSFATVDLMCSPAFHSSELGKLREAVWHTQCMGRIGNLLASWRRESADHDYTSGVFARAVVTGDLSLDQLSAGDPRTIESAIRTGDHERYFFRRWQHHKHCYRTLADEIHSVDLRRLLKGHEQFFLMHLGSRGLI